MGIVVVVVVETGLAVVLKEMRIAGHMAANSKLVHLQLVHTLVVVVVVVDLGNTVVPYLPSAFSDSRVLLCY